MEMLYERDAVVKLANYLKRKKFKLMRPIKIRGRIPDIIAVKDKEIFFFEVKGSKGDILKGVAQTLHYSHCGNYSYLAVPKGALNKDIINSSKRLGIGIFSIDTSIREIVSSQRKEALPSVKKAILTSRKKMKLKKKSTPKPKGTTLPIDEIFESKKVISILRVLCNRPKLDFSISEISQETNIDKSAISKIVSNLEKRGLIKSYCRGRLKLCQLNMNHAISDAFVDLFAKEYHLISKSEKWLI